MSVDSELRLEASKLLQSWIEGDVSNFELEDRWPTKKTDGALAAVAEHLWLLYDDFPKSYLNWSGLTQVQQALVRRCIEFLESDYTYKWPSFSYITGNLPVLSRILPGGSRRRRENIRDYESNIDLEIWPFHPTQR